MSSRRGHWLVRLLGVGAVLAGLSLLAGCLPFGLPLAPAPASTPQPTSAGSFAAFYDQQVDWHACETEFECATVTAPLDWEDPQDARTIELAVIRHPAAVRDPIGSLFMNPGGPGGSGYDWVRDSYWYGASADVVAQYDIVGWDPRGVGRSHGVTCYTDPADIAGFLYYVPSADPVTDPDGWIREGAAVGEAFGEACLKNTGEVLEFIDTLSTVRDLDLLRAVVDDPVLNFIGWSYGTAIGSIYVDEYPDRVGRIVLDGVVDRTRSLLEGSTAQLAGFELALTHFVEACPTAFDGCPLSGDVEADLARIHDTLEAFEREPVTQGGRTMTGLALRTAVIYPLYSESLWPQLSQILTEVWQPSPILDTAWVSADGYNDFTPGVGFSSSLQDSFTAIYCVDYPVETDPAVLAEFDARGRAVAPTLTLDLPPAPDAVCGNWPFQYRGGQHGQLTGKGAAPVLVVSTTGDPATPYEEGVALAEALESAVLLSFDGEGHTAYSAYGNACVVRTVDDYLLRGSAPQQDVWCDSH